ncbi:MAG: hypothetical protein VW443_02275 [Pseudomonadales bacterium]
MKITFAAKDIKNDVFYDFPWEVDDPSASNWVKDEWLKLRAKHHLPEFVIPLHFYSGFPEDESDNHRLRDTVQQNTQSQKADYSRIRLK